MEVVFKIVKLIFKSKLHGTLLLLTLLCGTFFGAAKLSFADCVAGAQFLLGAF
jgi:hypothetical protein